MKLPTLVIILINIIICIEALNQTKLSQQLNILRSIQLDTIQINENLEPNTQIANLTQLIHNQLSTLLSTEKTAQLIKIESVHLTKPSQYFKIDEKKISYDQFIIDNIDLRTTDKQIDSEVVCTANQKCQLKIELAASFSVIDSIDDANRTLPIFLNIEINDLNDNKPAFLQDSIKIEMDLDNPKIWTSKRFINIPLKLGYDLDVSEVNRIKNYSIKPESVELFIGILTLNKMPTELLITLDALDKDFINRIKLQPVQEFILVADDIYNKAYQQIQITFKGENTKRNINNKFSVFVNNYLNVTRSLNQTVIPLSFPIKELQGPTCTPDLLEFSVEEQTNGFARDTKFYYDQKRSVLNLRILNEPSKAQVGNYKFKLVASCGYNLTDTVLVVVNLIDVLPRTLSSSSTKYPESQTKLDIISALNDLEIKSTAESDNVFELVFKNVSSVRQTFVNDTYVTFAYLIGKSPILETNKLGKFSLERIDRFETNVKDLIKINEMRNGLYAVAVKREYLDRIRKFNFAGSNQGVEYFIELKLMTHSDDSDDVSLTITRYLSLRIPEDLVPDFNKLQTLKLGLALTTTPSLLTISNEFNLSFFNSVVLITVLSVVLILVGVGCFVISLTLYVLSKLRSKKAKNDNQFSAEKMNQKNIIFNSSQLIEADSSSNNSESGIASGSQTRSTSSSSASSLMHQSLNESINKKHEEDSDGPTIMVYDVMPSQQMKRNQPERSTTSSVKKSKPNLMDRIYRRTNEIFLSKDKSCEQHIYTISSSESGSYNKHNSQSLSSNNISPVTTTTITSGIDSLINKQKKGLSELYKQNNLSNPDKQTEKDIIYEWFIQSLNQETKDAKNTSKNSEIKVTSDSIKDCISKTSQLISLSSNSINAPTLSLATSTPTTNEAFSKDYRDEIYRNSHLVLKNYTNANSQSSNNYSQYYRQLKKLSDPSSHSTDMSTYEARPLSLIEQTKECDLIINQNSKLDSNFLSRPPPPMPPARLESYMLGSQEMSGVKIVPNVKDDSGKISCV